MRLLFDLLALVRALSADRARLALENLVLRMVRILDVNWWTCSEPSPELALGANWLAEGCPNLTEPSDLHWVPIPVAAPKQPPFADSRTVTLSRVWMRYRVPDFAPLTREFPWI